MVDVLWTGGFDSTAHVLRSLRAGEQVDARVIVDLHPPKAAHERDRRRAVLDGLEPEERRRVNVTEYAYQELRASSVGRPVWDLHEEICEAFGISLQYGALAMMRDLLWSNVKPALCVVVGDQVWHSAGARGPNVATSPIVRYLERRFVLPTWDDTKGGLFRTAHTRHRALLRLTWSCEADGIGGPDSTPCGDRLPYESQCIPCRGRLLALAGVIDTREAG